MLRKTGALVALGLGLALSTGAMAQDTVKIGVILPYSGPFADAANQLDAGIKAFIAKNGDTVAGKKIEIIRKDSTGPKPDEAKRLAQELVVRDGVDILAGFALTPEALGAAEVATEAKKMLVVMNAATSIITTKSPYMARTSVTIPQLQEPFGGWAYKSGVRKVYTMVSDYGPGHDAEQAFIRGFKEAGGEVVGSVRMPVANPEAVFIFIPGGAQPAAMGKALAERGLTPPAVKILAQGELTHPEAIESMGATAKGIITSYHFVMERDDPINNEFVKAYRDANGGRSPDLFSYGGYDGMHLIYEALKKTNGDASGDALVAAAKGLSWQSPRGPVSIDPETRDIVQTVYIREVQDVGGTLQNVIIDSIANVKDPLHGAAK